MAEEADDSCEEFIKGSGWDVSAHLEDCDYSTSTGFDNPQVVAFQLGLLLSKRAAKKNIQSWDRFPRKFYDAVSKFGMVAGETALMILQHCIFPEVPEFSLEDVKTIEVVLDEHHTFDPDSQLCIDQVLNGTIYAKSPSGHNIVMRMSKESLIHRIYFDKSGQLHGYITMFGMEMMRNSILKDGFWAEDDDEPGYGECDPLSIPTISRVDIDTFPLHRLLHIKQCVLVGMMAADGCGEMPAYTITKSDPMEYARAHYGTLVGDTAMILWQHIYMSKKTPLPRDIQVLIKHTIAFPPGTELLAYDSSQKALVARCDGIKEMKNTRLKLYTSVDHLEHRKLICYGNKFTGMTREMLRFLLTHQFVDGAWLLLKT